MPRPVYSGVLLIVLEEDGLSVVSRDSKPKDVYCWIDSHLVSCSGKCPVT